MLEITVPEKELFIEGIEEFVSIEETTLQLEHSLISLSKWERKWHKPYHAKQEKTPEETLSYIRCMTLNKHVNPYVYYALTSENIAAIKTYIDDPMTATTFPKQEKRTIRRETVTAEIIYYWMITLHIPFECQKWHLNQLIALIEVCSRKNTPSKKMSQKELIAQQERINQENRRRFHSKG